MKIGIGKCALLIPKKRKEKEKQLIEEKVH